MRSLTICFLRLFAIAATSAVASLSLAACQPEAQETVADDVPSPESERIYVTGTPVEDEYEEEDTPRTSDTALPAAELESRDIESTPENTLGSQARTNLNSSSSQPSFPQALGASILTDPLVDEAPKNQLVPDTSDNEFSVAYEHLITGEFFHTIPANTKIEQPVLIEAGVAEEVTQELLARLDVQGLTTIEEGVQYNPLGVDLRLHGNSEAFSIEEISAGEKAVIKDYPDVWRWSVTPLKPGEQTLTLEAVVSLDDTPGSLQQSLLLTEKTVSVEGSILNMWHLYLREHWKIILTLGSIVVFGFLASTISYFYYRHVFLSQVIDATQSQEEVL